MNNKKLISNFNNFNKLEKTFSFPDKIKISECILRDGEQMAGLAFNSEDKLEMAKILDWIGVDEIESGTPASSEEDRKAIKKIVSENLNAKIVVLVRLMEKDIDLAHDLGVGGVCLSVPFGDIQRKYKSKWSDEELVSQCLKIAEYAKKKGLFVTISTYDNTRVSPDFLHYFLNKIKMEKTIDRMRVVDTVGAIHPEGMKQLIKYIKSIHNIEIEVHCHNDFGLGTANTIAALSAGAEIASVTVNGVGERSGNTALEEVVASLDFLYDVKTNIDLSKLKEASKKIEDITGVELQRHKAIVGSNSFRHESGMVVSGILKNSFVGEPFNPSLVGQKREIIIGKGSGRAALEYKLNELNLSTDINLTGFLKDLKELSIKKKRSISDEEIIHLYNS